MEENTNQNKEKIDFVIAWVDGSDEEWIKEKNKYKKAGKEDATNGKIRYRDWNQLKYWFRGVEKYAPWVNNIYFVTCGQKPEWLNENHPKLKLVNHTDYLNEKYLPTFSANPIELNFHKINGLSEKFVYFNDDMFLINPTKEEDFFKCGLPCDYYAETPLRMFGNSDAFSYMIANDLGVINTYFKKNGSIVHRIFTGTSIKYEPKANLKTIFMNLYRTYSAFDIQHIPSSFLKSTYEEVWDKEGELLDKVSCNKFRTKEDVNQYIFKYWQLCSNKFYPRRKNWGHFFVMEDETQEVIKAIHGKKYKTICINDSDSITDFEKVKNEINKAFEVKFTNKSAFEK